MLFSCDNVDMSYPVNFRRCDNVDMSYPVNFRRDVPSISRV